MQDNYNSSKKILMLVIVLATAAIVGLLFTFTFVSIQNLNSGGKGGKYLTLEYDGTKFKMYKTYGEILREIAAQRPIYKYEGVFSNDFSKTVDVDEVLEKTIKEFDDYKNSYTPAIKIADETVPGMLLSPAKDQEDVNKDKTTKLKDAHYRFIIYPMGQHTVLTMDDFTLDSEKTTPDEFKDYFGDYAQVYHISGEESAKQFFMHYKNCYVYIAFTGEKSTFSYLEILDIDIY